MSSWKEIFGVIGSSVRDIGNAVKDEVFGGDTKGNYTASFGRIGEVLTPASSQTGFAITSGKFLTLENHDHMAVVGGSGSGKSVNTTLVGVIEQKEASMVVLDNSGEMFERSAGAKQQDGYTVISFDLTPNVFTEETPCYNPLQWIEKDDAEGIAKLAKLLVRQSEEKRDFWSIKSEDVITLAITILLHRPPEEQTFYNLHILVQTMASNQDKVSEYVVGLGEEVFRSWEVLLHNSEKTLDSILSSALASTVFITYSKALQKVTTRNTIDFDELRNEKTVIYLRTPLDDSVVRPVISMFYTQFFHHFLKKPRPREKVRPILVFAEEFGSTYIPDFDRVISNIRKWQISVQLVVQNFQMISRLYGKEALSVIRANCSQLFFGGVEEAEEVSRMLGKVTHTDPKTNYKRDVDLMSASDIRSMDGKAIFLPKKGKPLLVPLRPYYESRRLRNRSNIPPPLSDGLTEIEPRIHPLQLPSYGTL